MGGRNEKSEGLQDTRAAFNWPTRVTQIDRVVLIPLKRLSRYPSCPARVARDAQVKKWRALYMITFNNNERLNTDAEVLLLTYPLSNLSLKNQNLACVLNFIFIPAPVIHHTISCVFISCIQGSTHQARL